MKTCYLVFSFLIVVQAGCSNRMTRQERDRYWDFRENLRQARVLKDRQAQASSMEALADALELGAKEARARGFADVAKEYENEAKRLRDEVRRTRSGR